MYFAGSHAYIISVMALLLLDVITGVSAAKKSGEPITAKRLGMGLLEKTGLYLILLIASFVLGLVMKDVVHIETYYITWLLTILIDVYEITSIIENVIKINPELAFLNKIKKLLNHSVDKQFEKVEKKLIIGGSETNSNEGY